MTCTAISIYQAHFRPNAKGIQRVLRVTLIHGLILQNKNFLKNMPKVITSAIKILKIILALLKTLKKKDGENQGFQCKS